MTPTDPATWETQSPAQTAALGEALGRCLVGGLSLGLIGTLGAGKTQLVKGIAVGNADGPAPAVTSPTFTLVNEYPGKLLIYHIDVYRLTGEADLAALGFDEMVRPGASVVVEWADRVRGVMPTDTLWIDMSVTGESKRRLSLRPGGPCAAKCLAALTAALR